ncbi:MAG TPA: hemolysin family protein [Egibacteraceae bacterium]|nr:hemolysin family protein [Egibacteraceae bacterium]
MLTALGLLAVGALIAANGYFVAAEFSFVAARRTRLEEAASAGDRRATLALTVRERLSFMLSGAQLGITATSLLVGYIAEPTLGRALRPLVALAGLGEQAAFGVAFTLGFIVATTAQMVVGELAPKNLAIARAEPVALSLARSTYWYTRLAGPVIRLFDNAANGLLRAVGIAPVQDVPNAVSPEELEHIIAESTREGSLTAGQAGLLSRALDFRSLRAGDVMVARPQIVSIPADATCEDLRRLAVESGHSRFPVVGGDLDDVRGVVQAKDVFRVDAAVRARAPVRSLLQPTLAVPETATVGSLLGELRAAHSPLAVVVDEHGGTAGIVTLEDIVEELVGEIRDEHDPAEPGVQALRDGSFLVPGGWRIDETARDTGVALPEGDYDTVGGLVMASLGRVPEPGDIVEVDGARLQVHSLTGLAVGAVRLVPAGAGSARHGSPHDGDGGPR